MDFKNPLGLTKSDVDHINAFDDIIGAENKRVKEAYRNALRNEKVDVAAIQAIEGGLDNDLKDVA